MDNTKEMNTSGFTLLPFDPIVLVQDVMKRWLVIVLAVVMLGVGTVLLNGWGRDESQDSGEVPTPVASRPKISMTGPAAAAMAANCAICKRCP